MTRRRRTLATVVLAAVIPLAGCGNDPDSPGDGTAAEQEAGTGAENSNELEITVRDSDGNPETITITPEGVLKFVQDASQQATILTNELNEAIQHGDVGRIRAACAALQNLEDNRQTVMNELGIAGRVLPDTMQQPIAIPATCNS